MNSRTSCRTEVPSSPAGVLESLVLKVALPVMTEFTRAIGPDALVESGARLLTPAVEHLYAVLVRVGVLSIDE
ncbi:MULTISPECIES: Rv1535 domain-containing protein [Gordonia]|uniref:Rv1535 domain-containing protein n=1 Tax=Gordonia TaxID=2053 RepID=UPI00338EA7FC